MNLHFVHIPFDMCVSVLHYYQNTQHFSFFFGVALH